MNEIAIQAQIISDDACQFIIDRPVVNGSKYFDGVDSAKGSPLAEKLFQIKNVDGILISNNVVKVSKLGFCLHNFRAKTLSEKKFNICFK